jgi:hypothetical protein
MVNHWVSQFEVRGATIGIEDSLQITNEKATLRFPIGETGKSLGNIFSAKVDISVANLKRVTSNFMATSN